MKPLDPASLRPDVVALSVRESRMIVERILLTAGLPEGFVPAVRDCVLYSQAMGLGGLVALRRDFRLIRNANPRRLALHVLPTGPPVLDCGGQHAWIVAPTLLDLVLASFRSGTGAEIVARNLAAPDELKLVEGYAGRYGADAAVTSRRGPDGPEGCVRVTADGRDVRDRVLEAALADGLPVPRTLWDDLYAWSHQALTPDSIESRRHAGPVMVDSQGRIHGRDDDDTDFSLLGMTTPAPVPKEA
jgi:hypothetical protein